MRCKTCGMTALSSVTTHAHCWVQSQQCSKCHYLGNRDRKNMKFSDEDTKKRKRGIFD